MYTHATQQLHENTPERFTLGNITLVHFRIHKLVPTKFKNPSAKQNRQIAGALAT